MVPDLEHVIKLQSLDARAADLEREITALPRHIAEIEKALDSHQRRLEADRASLSASQKERRQLEAEIKTHEQKISKLRDQMLEARTNEQYRAFQHEISFVEQAIARCEDRILELMIDSENLDQNVKGAESALKQEQAVVEAEKSRARLRSDEDRRQLELLKAERAQLVEATSREAYATYERTRKRCRPPAVAEAIDGRCTACQLEMRPQLLQDLRHGDQIMACENCMRILYYNPPVSFEDDVNATPADGPPAAAD